MEQNGTPWSRTRRCAGVGERRQLRYTGHPMATISITKKHQMTHKAAKAAAEKVAADLQQRFGLRYEWDGDRCAFERAGLTGELVVGATDVRLECTLGFLLGAIKP